MEQSTDRNVGMRHSGLSRGYWPPPAHLSQHEVSQIGGQVNLITIWPSFLRNNNLVFIIRYLKTPAQATRCSLHGVFPVLNLHGSVRNGVESFPIDLHLFMAQYEAKPAVAIFVDWQAGEVGHSEGSPFQELTANVVL